MEIAVAVLGLVVMGQAVGLVLVARGALRLSGEAVAAVGTLSTDQLAVANRPQRERVIVQQAPPLQPPPGPPMPNSLDEMYEPSPR